MSDHAHHIHSNHLNSSHDQTHSNSPATNTVKDPVCGMDVDPHTTKHKAMHLGRPYYFCLASCQTKFAADPDKYESPGKAEIIDDTAIYTCSMHPEIRQAGPGNCPICGMALEPVMASAEPAANHELEDMTRRFWIGLVSKKVRSCSVTRARVKWSPWGPARTWPSKAPV